mmetsp:Transcript_124966/g.347927  ORF Transcript_124966/g.347927 Transcript_124966/m.347927 type:complete len:241 (+) Transcript_124966:66-788(+)
MPRIGLLFELRSAETRPGEMVRVVGDRPELGHWDPYDINAHGTLELRTGPTSYPRWGLLAPVWIDLSEESGAQRCMTDEDTGPLSSSAGPSTPRTPQGVLDFESDEEEERGSCRLNAEDKPCVHIEYKFVKDRRQLSGSGPSFQWEDSIGNRRVTLPHEPGTIWVITDSRFNDASRAPELSRASLPEVVKRWGDLNPEWTSREDLRRAPEWGEVGRGDTGSPRSTKTYCSGHTTSTGLYC